MRAGQWVGGHNADAHAMIPAAWQQRRRDEPHDSLTHAAQARCSALGRRLARHATAAARLHGWSGGLYLPHGHPITSGKPFQAAPVSGGQQTAICRQSQGGQDGAVVAQQDLRLLRLPLRQACGNVAARRAGHRLGSTMGRKQPWCLQAAYLSKRSLSGVEGLPVCLLKKLQAPNCWSSGSTHLAA